jgi:uncharacterized membrane protein
MANKTYLHTTKKWLLAIGISISLWAMLFSIASAESIESFQADIVVETDGSLVVTEQIVYDFGSLERHGIFREIKNQHAQPASVWYKERVIELEPVSVLRNGSAEPYVKESHAGMYLKIGDAGRTISGTHTYEITYKVTGALSQQSDMTELYWNVTGNQWQIPIEEVRGSLRLSDAGALGEQAACYVGSLGSSERCQVLSQSDDSVAEVATFAHTSSLSPGEGVTIAQSLELGHPVQAVERYRLLYLLLPVVLLWHIGLVVFIVRWKYRHQDRTTVIAEYEPYEHFQPVFTGVLFDGRLDARDITAGIVQLAEQGFIRITQKTDKVLFVFETQDYDIELLRPVSEVGGLYQKELLHLLFMGQKPVAEGVQDSSLTALSLVQVGKKVRLSKIKKNQSKLLINAKALKALEKTVSDRMKEEGFLESEWSEQKRMAWIGLGILGAGILLVFLAGSTSAVNYLVFIWLFVSIPASLILMVIFTLDRRTQKGFEAMYYLRGFKEFLSVTEKERYVFHNAPAKSPEQFMQFLPYAIAFGVEKEWSKVFADISMASPDWYRSEVAGSQFNAAVFASELGSFSGALTTSTRPASSGSGSSGGGFSGGGSGGGGGGSW